jgi:hypothetical protein
VTNTGTISATSHNNGPAVGISQGN